MSGPRRRTWPTGRWASPPRPRCAARALRRGSAWFQGVGTSSAWRSPVNFLLHHHLAARDLGSPEAAVGAMLPDLWRMADRRVRAIRRLAAPGGAEGVRE